MGFFAAQENIRTIKNNDMNFFRSPNDIGLRPPENSDNIN